MNTSKFHYFEKLSKFWGSHCEFWKFMITKYNLKVIFWIFRHSLKYFYIQPKKYIITWKLIECNSCNNEHQIIHHTDLSIQFSTNSSKNRSSRRSIWRKLFQKPTSISVKKMKSAWKFEILTIAEPAKDNTWFPMDPNKNPLILYKNWYGMPKKSK